MNNIVSINVNKYTEDLNKAITKAVILANAMKNLQTNLKNQDVGIPTRTVSHLISSYIEDIESILDVLKNIKKENE